MVFNKTAHYGLVRRLQYILPKLLYVSYGRSVAGVRPRITRTTRDHVGNAVRRRFPSKDFTHVGMV